MEQISIEFKILSENTHKKQIVVECFECLSELEKSKRKFFK